MNKPYQLNLHGILLPFPTPFDSEGDVDIGALRSNLLKWNATGIVGCVALGSTGERVHLDGREYLEVLEVAREAVPPHLTFIAGAGQQSTRGSIGEIRRAARAGADAVLVITPGFYRSAITQTALFDYYTKIADASEIPILLYSIPQLTGITLQAETVARLAEHRNIIAIKDSSGDVINLAETIRLARKDFAVLTGNGQMLYAALSAGAGGAILAVGCVAPHLAIAIYEAVRRDDYDEAIELQGRLTPLARAVTVRYGIGGLKAAMEQLGYAGGNVRAPLENASNAARREIAHLIEQAGLLREASTGTRELAGASTD